MPDALPAVTVPPSFLKIVGSLAIVAASASGRTCSSSTKSTVSRLTLTGTGTICSSKRPSSCAAFARRCDSTANASCSSREIAIFSA